MKRTQFIALLVCLCTALTVSSIYTGGFWYSANAAEAQSLEVKEEEYREESYAEYLAEHSFTGVFATDTIEIELPEEGDISPDTGTVSWTFYCEQAGFYNIYIEYIPVPGSGAQLERRLLLDGEIPYKGMEQLIFTRLYDNTGGKEISIKNNNEIRPKAIEVFQWKNVYIEDSLKRSESPYILYLSQGEHELTLESISEQMLIRRLCLQAAPVTQSYDEQYPNNAPIYKGEPLTYQAERIDGGTLAVYKTSLSISNEADYSSPDNIPYHPWQIRLNVIGGSTWRTPGESIIWEVEVPEDGLYALSIRAAQNLNRGVTSFRRLYINGKTPFTESSKLGFTFTEDFNQYVIGENNNEPYLVYFNKGKNSIMLENVMGELAKPLAEVEKCVIELNGIYLQTQQLTGLVPDKYIDYEIAKKIPGYADIMAAQAQALWNVVEMLVEITGDKSDKTALVETIAIQCERIAEDPERVIVELGSFKNNISALGEWLISISEMPLKIDSLTLYAPETAYEPKVSGALSKLWNGTLRFLATFFVDETKLSDEEEPKEALTVWVPTGRDQAQIIKNMIDDDYAATSGNPIDLQLIPLDVVLPATLSGSGPDVVMDMPQSSLMNFAIRGALTDVSELDGYNEIIQQFFKSGLETVTFLDGVYGLPERQWFPMMYIREDIFSDLGLEIPRTWDEFKKTIVELNIEHFDAYMPEISVTGDTVQYGGLTVFQSMLYQYGGKLYKGEGDDFGIATALYSDEAMRAFGDYTNFFTSYKLPMYVNFANRFRSGEMPMGIADYTMYNTLEIFAPEIRGLWSFYPMPGVENEDGNINNRSTSWGNYTVIMSSCEDQETAWNFVQWWLNTETQASFGNSLEAVLGSAGRYASANKDVLRQLPWKRKAVDQLLAQFENTVGIPEVPGNYMTNRMVDFAFKSVVTGTSAMSPRQALYLKLLDIDKELTKKRAEFRLSTLEDVKSSDTLQ